MKKMFSILVLSCLCLIIHAQIQDYLHIELSQTGFSYTTDSTRNNYYPEFNVKQDDYMFVHDADSSYMVGEIPIAFKLTHQMPSFHGGDPSEFCNWIGKKIIDLLDNDNIHSFWFTVDFLLSSDGKVKDVRVDPYHSDKEHTSLDENILKIIKDSPKWVPEIHYWKPYCTPFSLHISSDHFVKGKGR